MDANAQNQNDLWLHRFAVLTAVITFFLLGVGGLVTSHEAGMSVPDWPTSYGYNMFALPIKFWKGGAFFEHTHRLLASGAGLLTTILAVWLWLKDSRRWMKWLGVLAFLLVVAQGVLGGLRVTMKMDSLGIIHGVLAQSFFVLTCAIALFTSRFWFDLAAERIPFSVPRGLRSHFLCVTILVFLQLILGATMRHQHAGLAIPDFPLAYGKIWPAISADAIARYNADRIETTSANPITAFQILLQMAHRGMAVAILAGVAVAAALSRKRLGGSNPLTKLAWLWLALIAVQAALGAWTVWSNKAADVATAHVLVGALSLVTGALWCLVAWSQPALGAPASLPASRAPNADSRGQDAGAPGTFGAALAANK